MQNSTHEDLLFCRLKRRDTSSGFARLICLSPACCCAGAATTSDAKSNAGASGSIVVMERVGEA
jgi:hypothetical protein